MYFRLRRSIVTIALARSPRENRGRRDGIWCVIEGHKIGIEGRGEEGGGCGDFRVGSFAFEDHFDGLGSFGKFWEVLGRMNGFVEDIPKD